MSLSSAQAARNLQLDLQPVGTPFHELDALAQQIAGTVAGSG
jgi:hypothetical protein